jgi:hypothetical protein
LLLGATARAASPAAPVSVDSEFMKLPCMGELFGSV